MENKFLVEKERSTHFGDQDVAKLKLLEAVLSFAEAAVAFQKINMVLTKDIKSAWKRLYALAWWSLIILPLPFFCRLLPAQLIVYLITWISQKKRRANTI